MNWKINNFAYKCDNKKQIAKSTQTARRNQISDIQWLKTPPRTIDDPGEKWLNMQNGNKFYKNIQTISKYLVWVVKHIYRVFWDNNPMGNVHKYACVYSKIFLFLVSLKLY